MPRYVLLEHDHPFLHWDFMLEAGGMLRTWRLALPPAPGSDIAATPLGDHRLAYLDYEGPLSGDRGTVKQWDQGEFDEIEQTDQRLVVRLRGRKLNGTATLDCDGAGWSFHFA